MNSVRYNKSRSRRERRKRTKRGFQNEPKMVNLQRPDTRNGKIYSMPLPMSIPAHIRDIPLTNQRRAHRERYFENVKNEIAPKTGKKATAWIKTGKKVNTAKDLEKCRDLLVNGYCVDIENKDIISTIGLYVRPLSVASERAIASAHFFANIINNYQKEEGNQCPFMDADKHKDDAINLLNYIYIRGGALRDTMLSRDISDIDFVIDTTGLNKVYYDHLVKYHSKHVQQDINCPCFMWQRYLNMYRQCGNNQKFLDIDVETNVIKKLEKNMVRSDFLLNARFMKDIILKSRYQNEILLNKIIHAINTWGYTNWVLNVDDTLLYKGIDLKGARFDLGDEMSNSYGTKAEFTKHIVDPNQTVFSQWNDGFDHLWKLKNGIIFEVDDKFKAIKNNFEIVRDKSIYVCHPDQDGDDKDVSLKEALIDIRLPLFSFINKYSHQMCDFTLNGIRLPAAEIFDVDDTRHIHDNYMDFNWYSKILNYSYSNSVNHEENVFKRHNRMGIDAIKQKVIKQPDLHILTTEYCFDDYFWRFIKILTKFVDYIHDGIWKIDEKTLDDIKSAFRNHFKLLNEEKMNEFVNRLLFWNVNDDNFEVMVRNRFRVFKLMGIDGEIKAAFKIYIGFRKILQMAVMGRLNAQKQLFMVKTLKNFGYPKNMLSINVPIANINQTRRGNAYNSNQQNTTYSTRKF